MPNIVRALIALTTLCLSAPAQAPDWHVIDQTTHNETTRLLTSTSINTFPAEDGSLKHVTIQFKCSGTLTSSVILSVDSGATFAVKSTAATTTLPIRLDNEPAIHAGWANLSLHQILLYDLRDLLPAHNRMSIDLPLGPAALQTLTFDLTDLASTMQAHNCRRRLPR